MVTLPGHGYQLSLEMLVSYWWLASDHALWHWKPKSTLRGQHLCLLSSCGCSLLCERLQQTAALVYLFLKKKKSVFISAIYIYPLT